MRVLPILLTRPLPASERLARRLADGGAGRIVISPLMRIVPAGDLPKVAGGVLFTSGHAVETWRALGGGGGLPAWVVGPRTADLARAAGFDVRGVTSDAAGLAQAVPADAPPLTHLRGAVQRGDLAAGLRARGLQVADAVIYRQDARPLTAEARDLLAAGPTLAPLYSPRTARLLAEAVGSGPRSNLRPICLSGAVVDAAPVPPLAVAERPNGAAMLHAILANLRPS